MLKTFLSFTSLIFVLWSSIFLVKGYLMMTDKEILDLSGTYWSSSPFAMKSLCEQKADAIVGTIFLLLSFVLQLRVIYLPSFADDFINVKGVSMAIFISFIFLFLDFNLSNGLSIYIQKNVIKISKVK